MLLHCTEKCVCCNGASMEKNRKGKCKNTVHQPKNVCTVTAVAFISIENVLEALSYKHCTYVGALQLKNR